MATPPLKQKPLSLPKLSVKQHIRDSSTSPHPKQHASHRKILSPSKITHEVHKTKWSMAPKCLIEGHEGRDIIYVCVHPQCKMSSRLVCETCFFKSHKEHNDQFLAIDQIKRGDISKLRYWPFPQNYRKIYEFVNEHDNYISKMTQDVNATFQGMATRILTFIDKTRLDLIKSIDSFYIRQSTKKDFVEKVKTQLEKSFDLKKVRDTVRSMFNKEFKHQIFSDKMKDVLNNPGMLRNREMLLDYFDKADKGQDMVFDKMYFLKKENWIVQQIEEQKKSLKVSDVTVNQTELGIQKVLPQTLAYLDKQAEGHYPLTFEKKLLEDGSEYTGFYEKGVRTMFGMRKYKNGFIYYGQWRINAKNGWGIFENKASGYRYTGCWKEDKKNGYGRQQTLTTVYEGNFVGDKKEGFGIMTIDGLRYEVTWKNDKKHGAGKRIQKNGNEVQVYYLNGIESRAKGGKANLGFNLKALTKKFVSKSTGDNSS